MSSFCLELMPTELDLTIRYTHEAHPEVQYLGRLGYGLSLEEYHVFAMDSIDQSIMLIYNAYHVFADPIAELASPHSIFITRHPFLKFLQNIEQYSPHMLQTKT